LPYRPELDGLRAAAILPVVAYHAGAPLPGGFTGVDVFFVLSGWLIGGLLWAELRATGRLRLGAFWLRRLRRLAPAYLLMAGATAAAAWWLLLPWELREMGKQLVAATAWLSNVLFWRQAGYFDTAAQEKPFLHTWSLAVEEQFYLVLPVALLALALLRARAGGVVAALVLAWGASLLATLWLTASRPEAAFFLFPFRAWELLTGVLLAVLAPALPRRARLAAGWAGLGLILGAALFVRAEGFPGWQALVPVGGTALCLMALGPPGAPEGVGRWLATPAPVLVGRLSYALYLWHWPILVLAAYRAGGALAPGEAAGWVALAFALALLSWRLVETPLRRPGGVMGDRAFLGLTALGMAAVMGAGAWFYRADGLPARWGAEVAAHAAASQDFLQDWSRCATPAAGAFAGLEVCAVGPRGEAPRVLIWGDSHLRALMDGIARAADEAGVPGLILWRAGCPPAFGLQKRESAATPAEDAACPATVEAVARALEAAPEIGLVVLVGRWAYYATAEGAGRDAGNRIALAPLAGSGLPEGAGQAELFAEALGRTVAALRASGREVAVLRQVPELPLYDSRAVARGLAHGRIAPGEVAGLMVPDLGRAAAADAALARTAGARRLDPWPWLCDPGCGTGPEGAVTWFDTNHLTNAGARRLVPLFAPLLREAGR
jgi:peptidoglycan/LPS O-acetylase OafA/YrhL